MSKHYALDPEMTEADWEAWKEYAQKYQEFMKENDE